MKPFPRSPTHPLRLRLHTAQQAFITIFLVTVTYFPAFCLVAHHWRCYIPSCVCHPIIITPFVLKSCIDPIAFWIPSPNSHIVTRSQPIVFRFRSFSSQPSLPVLPSPCLSHYLSYHQSSVCTKVIGHHRLPSLHLTFLSFVSQVCIRLDNHRVPMGTARIRSRAGSCLAVTAVKYKFVE